MKLFAIKTYTYVEKESTDECTFFDVNLVCKTPETAASAFKGAIEVAKTENEFNDEEWEVKEDTDTTFHAVNKYFINEFKVEIQETYLVV